MLLVHLFVYFARVSFCPFTLPLGVRVWQRLGIVFLLFLTVIVIVYMSRNQDNKIINVPYIP